MDVDKLFHQILKPALGCTEPVAIALASAAALHAAYGWTPGHPILLVAVSPEDKLSIHVQVSRSILKNAFAIAIPNAQGHKGIPMSAALGVFCNPQKLLTLFQDIKPAHVTAAESWVSNHQVTVEVADVRPSEVYIRVDLRLGHRVGACVIRGEHSRIESLWRNGERVYESTPAELAEASNHDLDLHSLEFNQLVEIVEHLPDSVNSLIRQTVQMNVAAAHAGVERPMGIGTGYFGVNQQTGNPVHQIASLTAAGSDARMSGHPVEIMTSAGSGNQGIMATIPIVVYARAGNVDEMRMLRGVALAHLVTMYLTTYIGYLSALCGVAIKAGIGAACGLTYVMGGGVDEIGSAVNIMAATLTGMICDGAKAGCALKVSITSDMALRAATLAMKKAEVPDDNGIVGRSPEETIQHLEQLGKLMEPVDDGIVRIMLEKARY